MFISPRKRKDRYHCNATEEIIRHGIITERLINDDCIGFSCSIEIRSHYKIFAKIIKRFSVESDSIFAP